MLSTIDLVRSVAAEFCLDFIRNPYSCYTEHGIHALFFTSLFNALPEERRYTTWLGQKVCILQKEYPTFGCLGKPQRQHWDIAVIKDPPESALQTKALSYDYLRLMAVVEFGLNEAEEHLVDDMERLCHVDANVDQGVLIHLYRISQPGHKFSNRDWSSNSARVTSIEQIARLTIGKPVEIYYGIVDSTKKYRPGVVRIAEGSVQNIL